MSYSRGNPLRNLFYHRLRAKCGSDFNNTEEDFLKFRLALGPVPETMKNPVVGRIDHTKGYVFDVEKKRWNFEWQEAAENNAESQQRRNKVWRKCPHCNFEGQGVVMRRWHFDRCSHAKTG